MNFSSQNILFAGWGCENPQDTYMHQIWYLTLKKIFPNIQAFDSKRLYFQDGKDVMNNLFIQKIKKNKYDLIIFAMDYDEFYPETIEKIRKISPDSKLMLIICDDDARFDSWSRYIGLFFDGIIQSPERKADYQKEGIKDSFFHFDYNTYKLEPMNLEKIYDLTFIGRPKADRVELMKFLMEKGVNIKLFGWGWGDYPELKKIYGGSLSQEDYAKIINQTKINLNFTRAGYSEEKQRFNMKGRFFEVALCKGFQLIENYQGIEKFFKDKKEVVLFNTKEDILNKIRYYLKNDKLMKEIAENSYKKTISKYNREEDLKKIFKKIFAKKTKSKNLPIIKGKIITLNKKNIFSGDLTKMLENYDYVTFRNNNLRKESCFKRYFLARALEATGKKMACCDYFVSSFGVKDYMIFTSKFAFGRIKNKANNLIDINQIMVRKDFFQQNIAIFKRLFNGENINLIEEKNTAFVSTPLVSIKKNKKINYEDMIKSFEMKFPNFLFSLMYKNKLFFSSYPYKLLFRSIFGNSFIIKYLLELKKSKNTKEKLSVNSAYLENSPLEKLAKTT